MMFFKFKDKFFLLGILYVFLVLAGLLILTFIWLPPGYTLAGHDSGLPLDAKQFLATRFYAWDDRLGFGLENSANFGSITIHFFDLLFSAVGGTPYAGNYVSVFFWLGLVFLSGFVLAYQLKDKLGKPFVFILPVLLTFNFYIFQSMFMLERAKYGIFAATLISLAVFFRMQGKKLGVVASAIISALAFSIFNGGGVFGITLYGGVVLILGTLLLAGFLRGLTTRSFEEFKKTLSFIALSAIFYLLFNSYSILPYLKNFLADEPSVLFQESFVENSKEWLVYVSRSSSFLNLFRFLGVPDWYGGFGEFGKANPAHPYASFYLNNKFLLALSFLFPVLSFSGLLLAKRREQKRVLGIFATIALLGIFFTAGSHAPLGFVYEFLMETIPGFFIFRSAFYKFGIFYMLGMLVLLSFTLSFLAEKLSRTALIVLFTFLSLSLWLGYHWVLFQPEKVFTWTTDQTTRASPPQYIYEFADWVQKSNLTDKRVLLLPPLNEDWQSDAYNWGYWSLSPLPSALTSARFLSNWHALTSEERNWVSRLYGAIKKNDEEEFFELAQRLNVGYLLLREDVLADSTWSSAEQPENYKMLIESFDGVRSLSRFGKWDFYGLAPTPNNRVYATASVSIIPDRLLSLGVDLFEEGHMVGDSNLKKYKEIEDIAPKNLQVYDCLSCLIERKGALQSLPEVSIFPNSLFYYFKEREEQKLLAEHKDSRSRIADDLGLILRRTAELSVMIDLLVKERYLIENAEVIGRYLDNLYFEIESDPENPHDFELLRQVLDFLTPVEGEFSNQINEAKRKGSGVGVRDEFLAVVWRINRVKDLFGPLLENPDRWSTEKVYRITFSEAGDYTLFLNSRTLPQDLESEVIMPKVAELTRDGQTKGLEFASDRDDWLSSKIGYQDKGVARLVLQFEKLPNLVNIEGSGLEEFAFGKAACHRGKIANFDKNRAYEVLVSKTDRLRSAKVIFSDKNREYSQKHGFLLGEDAFEVATLPEGEFSRHVYHPSSFAKDITIYVCSEDVGLPAIDEIVVREFFSPLLAGVKSVSGDVRTSPEVEYTRINPTRYEVRVRDAQGPFLLLFNEKFNPSWRLSVEDEAGNLVVNKKHIMVDGYANGWLLDQTGTKDFKIEYVPQRWFYFGSVVSLGSFLAGIGWLARSGIKGRKR